VCVSAKVNVSIRVTFAYRGFNLESQSSIVYFFSLFEPSTRDIYFWTRKISKRNRIRDKID